MANFWDLIVQTNTFNFIVMLAIFAILWQKLNVSEKIEGMRTSITEFIEKSKQEKDAAQKYLKEANNSVENLDSEIKAQIDKAETLAHNVFEEIQAMTEKSIEKIQSNVEKIIDNETRKAVSKLTNETANDAVILAKSMLKEKFIQNPQLHDACINEAINALDGVL